MKRLFLLLLILQFFGCANTPDDRYIIFLHNRFLETNSLEDEHPKYGKVDYHGIVQQFEKAEFEVLSKIRKGENINATEYADSVIVLIDSLISLGIPEQNITIVGISKGGYIAQYVATEAKQEDLNYVFVGAFNLRDVQDIPQIQFSGNVLNIYEKSDPYSDPAITRVQTTKRRMGHFKDLEINTGLNHGFIFVPRKEWIEPTIEWALSNYQ